LLGARKSRSQQRACDQCGNRPEPLHKQHKLNRTS
jgi:hypothetical protein